MSRYSYSAFGVCFASDVSLALPEAPSGSPVRFALLAATGPWPGAERNDLVQQSCDGWTALRIYSTGELELEWKEWLWFWIDPLGQTVRYRVCEDRYPAAFAEYVTNFAISSCLMLQGEEVLHSTVVYYQGTGVGLLGPSGAGKSTLSAYLLGLGAELVTDDMLRITENDGTLWAEAGQPRLKLFEEAARTHLAVRSDLGRWNPVSEKYLFDVASPTTARQRRPLHALVFLEPPEPDNPGVRLRPVKRLEAFQLLQGSTMNSRLETADRLARLFMFVKFLLERVPVYALQYPRRHEIFPEVISVLEGAILGRDVAA